MSKHNHLAKETSLYLQQHATNPVEWYPWNVEALARAKKENKPILLSIGYSACHWCHVMAEESFSDVETAKLMNKYFINIKVDREERPDLDKIYQTAFYLFSERGGGWPLTMFLMPDDQIPFFGGTYFPLRARQGLPAFKEILQKIHEVYTQDQTALHEQNAQIRKVLHDINHHDKIDELQPLNATPLRHAYQALAYIFDPIYGGFGDAPKFPHPTHLQLLLHHMVDNPTDRYAVTMLQTTLTHLAEGGIYDHIGGGFFRYSVDEEWMIPHFEKMLCDNGLLLSIYAQAAKAFSSSLFAKTAIEMAEWIIRDMQIYEGGYCVSVSADSEHKEGKFYIWDKKEIREILDDDTYPIFAARYGLDDEANFESYWHLYVTQSLDEIVAKQNIDETLVVKCLEKAKQTLLTKRIHRHYPDSDEKILTSWNALTIKGMALAGHYLQRPDFIASAEHALKFVQQRMWNGKRLFATCKNDHARFKAYLDDYVFLIDAILTLLQIRWSTKNFEFAIALAEVVLTHFRDTEQGGFFFTADDHEALIQRPKVLVDEAMPAGNSITAYVLGRLGYILGEPRYLREVETTLKMAWLAMHKMPHAHDSLLFALREYLHPPRLIILRGNEMEIMEWKKIAEINYAPHQIVLAIPDDVSDLPESLARYVRKDNQTTAYICEGHTCSAPITDKEIFTNQIR